MAEGAVPAPAPGVPVRFILPGESQVSWSPCRFTTVLGSCVSVTLFNRRFDFGGMNHYMLPDLPGHRQVSEDDSGALKYGTMAIPALINGMLAFDPDPTQLTAKLFGGGAVVSSIRDSHIGDENVAIARDMLASYRIPVISESVGHRHGLKVLFDSNCNRVFVRPVRKSELVETGKTTAAGKRLLLISDDRKLGRELCEWLAGRPANHRVAQAETLFTARTLLQKDRFDYLIIDTGLPHLDLVRFAANPGPLNRDSGLILLLRPGADLPVGIDNIQAMLETEQMFASGVDEVGTRSLPFL
ncbi:MAG TPA: hypothetical protein PKM88_10790 [bacterium]|nr:hypothetical protein [bacterium]